MKQLTERPLRTTLIICIASAALFPQHARAESYWRTVQNNAVVVIDTALGNLTAQQEQNMIGDNWDEWRRQRDAEKKKAVGQVLKGFDPDNLSFTVATYSTNDLGRNEYLSYRLIDPATGKLTSTLPDFTFASVAYYALLKPYTLDTSAITEAGIRANWTFLGGSSNPVDNYSISFTLQGFEPQIFAFPLDASGNEVTDASGSIDGVAGFASNVLFPVTGPLPILGVGAALGYSRKLRKRIKSS